MDIITFKILNSFAELDDDSGSFKLTFNIAAGKKYYFNNFDLILPDDYDTKDFEGISKIFNSLKKEQYSLDNINLILDEIEEIASLKLYEFIKVDVEETIVDNDKINYNF